ncbi:hypothetical protein CPC08DRAFT_716810 [Agrocybe pediades]|nr:hypothetical protein CPC08DRAFT_716810 [Agrocybe pediades]
MARLQRETKVHRLIASTVSTLITEIVPIDILTEAVAPNALHDSGVSFDKPKCHPRTRVKIREIIKRWILGKDTDPRRAGRQFMWLNGAAGCGKSAIAQSTIESCIERGVLLASFFFSRSDSTRNHAGPLVATLAYQLYCAFPETTVQTEILSAIKKDPLIFKKALQQQFTTLIIQPLMTHFSKIKSIQVPFLIIIDGLDECVDRTAQKAILTALANSLRNSKLSIPIFVASRPEHDIKLSFGSKSLKGIHTRLSLDLEHGRDADSDIRLYLFDRFAEIKDNFDNRTTGKRLDQDWPGDRIIDTLVLKSSGQFVYAATVIRFVESTRHRPDHRLGVILNLRLVNGDHPFAQLDSLYAMILESALDTEKVLRVLSLYLMDIRPSCCSVIEKLLLYDEGEVETLFCDMGALVRVCEVRDQLYLWFLHASFREYLLDATRSKQFHIDTAYEAIRYVILALQYLASCCSSSFDPSSIAGTPMFILPHVYYCMVRDHVGQITISLELQQSMLSFPLKEFLEPHSTSFHTYPKLLERFVTPFFALLEAMVLTDPTLTYIRDHQLGILRTVLLQQIQRYFNDDRRALVLVLFYHLGSHRFIPILKPSRPLPWSYSIPGNLVPIFDEDDILLLFRIWEFPFEDNVYHRFVRQLLRDPSLPAEYTVGPIMHVRAALVCFKELATIALPAPPSPSGKNIDIALIMTDDEEDDAHSKLTFCPVRDHAEDNIYVNLVFDSPNGGQWQFIYDEWIYTGSEELYFLLVGYLIFLLPRCGRSDALVAACQDYTLLLDDPFRSDDLFLQQEEESFLKYMYGRFPVRRRLFHGEINKYLARVSPNNMSESRI